jgi:tetratricopeptide (TPR) repeat protein
MSPGVVRAGRIALALLLVMAVWVQTDRALERLDASRRVRVVEGRSLAMMAQGGVVRQVVEANLRELEEVRRIAPGDVAVPMSIGSQYLVTGRPEAAVRAYQEALDVEPRPEVYLNLARARLALGEREAAGEAFAAAQTLAPRARREIPREFHLRSPDPADAREDAGR